MKLSDNIPGNEFSLLYQAAGFGPEGIVVLPPGNYFVNNLDRHVYSGSVWVGVKQAAWSNSVKISINDLSKFQNY